MAAITGCDALLGVDSSGDRGTTSNPATAVVEPGLVVRLTAPDTVAVGEAFAVRFAVQNPTGEAIDLTTSSSCLMEPVIMGTGGRRIPFEGATVGCLAVVTTHTIPAGEALVRTYNMRAAVSMPEGNEPVWPGRYTVQADLSWHIDGNEVPLSTLGRSLVVRP